MANMQKQEVLTLGSVAKKADLTDYYKDAEYFLDLASKSSYNFITNEQLYELHCKKELMEIEFYASHSRHRYMISVSKLDRREIDYMIKYFRDRNFIVSYELDMDTPFISIRWHKV